MEVVVWLRSLGLEQYEAAFRENGVDKTVLLKLTAEDVKDLGVRDSRFHQLNVPMLVRAPARC
jgi:hypothetical protein